jgi:hypothetical protein
MSTNGKQSTKGTKASNGETSTMAVIDEKELGASPEGFAEIYGERVAGWFLPLPGNVIQGILRDTFETESKFRRADGSSKKKVYKIEVTAISRPCYYAGADSEDNTPAQASVGDLIGVDEKGWLKSLAKVSLGQEVWIACLGKEPPSAEYPQGAWKYKVLAKPAKADPVTGEITS